MNKLLAPDTQVTHDEVVVVSVPSYIKNFESLISRTPKRYDCFWVVISCNYIQSVRLRILLTVSVILITLQFLKHR